jgi:GNAT superfamily N-acetyltransferase
VSRPAADAESNDEPGRDVSPPNTAHTVEPVTAGDLDDLLPLMRAYCDFYATAPSDEALLALSRGLLADPAREGIQLIARNERGTAVGFATLFWSWDTTEGGRIGIMNDLYLAPEARGSGVAGTLVERCRERCAQRGAVRLEWQTAPENVRAEALYQRLGAAREPWLTYSMPARRP